MDLPYPRLYLRMALYIAAALLAFVALGGASVAFVASVQLQSYTATKQSPLGRQAAAVLTAGGRPALERWLRDEANVPPDVTAYVLDASSQDILGRPLPRAYAGFVRDFVTGPPEAPGSNFRPVHLAPQLMAPDGTIYSFLVLPNTIDLWGSRATAIGLALVALIVVSSVAWIIARAFGRPIGELQRAVRELALGHTEARVPTAISSRRDELGALAADFNRMADQLAALLAGRQQLMGELSHELRSPLARMQASLELAGHRGSIGEPERERFEQEIRRMDRVIGDLLRFSRLDAAATVGKHLVRVDELLAELVRDEEVEAHARPCRLDLNAAPGLTVVGDPDQIRSGFENILRNAIRFAPPGTVVQLAAVRTGRELEVTIQDRGPGVPPELLTRIFEPYVRAPNTAGDSAGTGLGLAIARRIFEVHGGGVTAAPRPGGGLLVTVRLPVAKLS